MMVLLHSHKGLKFVGYERNKQAYSAAWTLLSQLNTKPPFSGENKLAPLLYHAAEGSEADSPPHDFKIQDCTIVMNYDGPTNSQVEE
jgi:hypothetical protein